MSKIRTMVVDDEPVARERIVGLLQQEKDIELVGECADGQQAINAIQAARNSPGFLPITDALFDLPDLNSLKVFYDAIGGGGTATYNGGIPPVSFAGYTPTTYTGNLNGRSGAHAASLASSFPGKPRCKRR